jgi:excisionase family DNA binding protein
MEEKPLSIKELSTKLSISRKKIIKLISKGLPHFKVGNRYKFFLSEVNLFLKSVK